MSEGEALSSRARNLGRYALFTEIASGGMATVYLGRQRGQAGFARTVAIKRLHPQHAKEPDFVSMFLDEARLAARIRHPNVVPTIDVVATDGELFLVMEYVQGESLARLLKANHHRHEHPPLRVVAAILADALHGLHAAHEATSERGEPLGLVHRDVSPHNVLVGVDGVARIVDFGIAKASGRIQTTREGQLKGKIAYMAPEQIRGAVTRKTDVYAASVCLWEAVTGKRLFHGENDAVVLDQVLNGQVKPPSEHVPGLDPAWDSIVLRGLERDPDLRYATAREMALDIESRLSLARATDVGAWVESLAHDALARRAAEVTRVESASDVDIAVPPAGPAGIDVTTTTAPAAAPPETASAREQTSSRVHALSRPVLEAPPVGRRSRAALVAAIVVAGVAIAAIVAATRPSTTVGAAASSASATSLPPAEPGAPVVAASTVVAAAPVAPSSTARPAAPSASPAPSASEPPATLAPTRAPRAGGAHAGAPARTKGPSLGSLLDTRH